jgi:hypothetical protein
MRRHKTVVRILLFLSIVNFTFAGVVQTPAAINEMRVDLVTGAEGVTEASERGHTQSEELPEWLGGPSTAGHLQSRFDVASAQSLNERAGLKDPEADKFFNEEMTRKMKEYFILGSLAGVFTGVANGMQKEIIGTVSPNAYVLISPPSPSCQHLNGRVTQNPILTMVYLSQTVGRAVEPLDEDPQDQEDLVSRSLSNMRDEELKMLSFISRNMLNSFD